MWPWLTGTLCWDGYSIWAVVLWITPCLGAAHICLEVVSDGSHAAYFILLEQATLRTIASLSYLHLLLLLFHEVILAGKIIRKYLQELAGLLSYSIMLVFVEIWVSSVWFWFGFFFSSKKEQTKPVQALDNMWITWHNSKCRLKCSFLE